MLSTEIPETTGSTPPNSMIGHLLDPQLLEVEASQQTKGLLVAGNLNFKIQPQVQSNW